MINFFPFFCYLALKTCNTEDAEKSEAYYWLHTFVKRKNVIAIEIFKCVVTVVVVCLWSCVMSPNFSSHFIYLFFIKVPSTNCKITLGNLSTVANVFRNIKSSFLLEKEEIIIIFSNVAEIRLVMNC